MMATLARYPVDSIDGIPLTTGRCELRRASLWVGLCVALSFCLGLSGCGNGLAQVSGSVTLDGQPLHAGKGDTRCTIQLQPADGVGANAVGLADENGNYKIATASQAGVRPGDYYVTCSVSTLGTGGPVADAKYANAKTSGFKLTVQPGKNEFNIPLQSPPKKERRPGT